MPTYEAVAAAKTEYISHISHPFLSALQNIGGIGLAECQKQYFQFLNVCQQPLSFSTRACGTCAKATPPNPPGAHWGWAARCDSAKSLGGAVLSRSTSPRLSQRPDKVALHHTCSNQHAYASMSRSENYRYSEVVKVGVP